MRSLMCLFVITLLTVGVAFTSQAVVQDDGLILYFSFDSDNGGTIPDETGGGNDGTMEDASISKNEVAHGTGSLHLDSGQSSVTVESFKELEEYEDNSFLFWVNFTDQNSGAWNQLVAKKAPGSDRSPGIWTCNRVTLHIHYRFNPGNQGTDCAGPDGEGSEFETDTWYHLAGVKEGGTLTFYIDGKEVAETVVPKDHVQGAESLYIGKTGYGSALFYIDDFYLYDRAVSAGEVSEIMDGHLLPVEPQDKLTATWGQLKVQRD